MTLTLKKKKKKKSKGKRAEPPQLLQSSLEVDGEGSHLTPASPVYEVSDAPRATTSGKGVFASIKFGYMVATHAPIASLLFIASVVGMIETGRQLGILIDIRANDNGLAKRAELVGGGNQYLQALSRLADVAGEGTTGVFVLLNIWLFFGIPFVVCMAGLAVRIAGLPKEARSYRALTRSVWGRIKRGGRAGKKPIGWMTVLPRQLIRSLRVSAEALTMGAQWQLPRGGWETLGKVIILLTLLTITGVLGYYAILVSSMASNDRGPNGSEIGADTLEKMSSTISPSGGLLMLNIFMLLGVPVIAFILYWFFKPNSAPSTTKTPLWRTILFFPRTVRRAIPDWLFNPIFVVVILVPYITVVLDTPWVLTQLFKLTGELSGRQVMLLANAFFLIMTPLMAMAVMKVEDVALRIWRGFRGKS